MNNRVSEIILSVIKRGNIVQYLGIIRLNFASFIVIFDCFGVVILHLVQKPKITKSRCIVGILVNCSLKLLFCTLKLFLSQKWNTNVIVSLISILFTPLKILSKSFNSIIKLFSWIVQLSQELGKRTDSRVSITKLAKNLSKLKHLSTLFSNSIASKIWILYSINFRIS